MWFNFAKPAFIFMLLFSIRYRVTPVKLQYIPKICLRFVPWLRHQMETFFALPALCEGNPPVTGGLPSQWQVTRGFGWARNRDAGDLRRAIALIMTSK